MYRIYINEIRLTIAEMVPNGPENYQLIEEKDFNISIIGQELLLKSGEIHYLVLAKRPEMLFESITEQLEFIPAAGGLVRNGEGNYLFIFRREKWDLPKGKIDAGETPEIAAVREVEEECGIEVDELGSLLTETYHIYPMDGELVLKKTFWYHMSVNDVPELVPQLEEDISQAVWLNPNDLASVKANTYPLIRDLIEAKIA